jgi:hypothetical protein
LLKKGDSPSNTAQQNDPVQNEKIMAEPNS